MALVVVRHNFETAHRLPLVGGKCRNLHGHSWWAEVTVSGEPDELGIVLDFGELKGALRAWIDERLDHGTMLGRRDSLVPALLNEGVKLFQFGLDGLSAGLEWPTVENVAELLARVADARLVEMGRSGVAVTRVRVSETHVNAAEVLW